MRFPDHIRRSLALRKLRKIRLDQSRFFLVRVSDVHIFNIVRFPPCSDFWTSDLQTYNDGKHNKSIVVFCASFQIAICSGLHLPTSHRFRFPKYKHIKTVIGVEHRELLIMNYCLFCPHTGSYIDETIFLRIFTQQSWMFCNAREINLAPATSKSILILSLRVLEASNTFETT